jgi:hypothetical protein
MGQTINLTIEQACLAVKKDISSAMNSTDMSVLELIYSSHLHQTVEIVDSIRTTE